MNAEPFLLELEVRGYLPWDGAERLGPHVSSAFFRRGSLDTVHDLVLVVDRTNPEGLPADTSAPHRTNRRPGPFAMPMSEVLLRALDIPTSLFAPLRRVTIIELADTPPTADDVARIDTYASPKSGTTLVGAAYVDTSAKTVHANDGASPLVTGLLHAEDPCDWARKAYGAPSGAPLKEGVALFGARAVGAISFFLSPVAGAALLAWNLHRTRRNALGALLFAATAVAVLVIMFGAGDGKAGQALALPLNLGGLFFCVKATRGLFGEPIRKASLVLALLLGFGSVTLVVGGGVGTAMIWEVSGEHELSTSNGSKVIHDRATNPTDAARAGEILVEHGVLSGPQSGVYLRKDGNEHSLHLVFDDKNAHEEPGVKDLYRKTARDLSANVFAGQRVSFVFESSTGRELGRVSSGDSSGALEWK